MGEPALRRATYADLCAAPANLVAELIGGMLHTSPRPAPRHAAASSVLGGKLGGPFHWDRGGPGGWWILDEPELHFDEAVVVSDLAGWRRERMPKLPDTAAFTLAPDWVCEVLSPSTARLDRTLKLPIYAREGVAHAWLIDPIDRTLEVYRRQGEGWLLVKAFGGDDLVRAEPFSAIELDLLPLWGEEREPPG